MWQFSAVHKGEGAVLGMCVETMHCGKSAKTDDPGRENIPEASARDCRIQC